MNYKDFLFCISDAIKVQPNNDAKLNPFNADWNTGYFESCSPVTDGKTAVEFYFKIMYLSFKALYIVFVQVVVLVDYTDVLVITFSHVAFQVQPKHYEQRSEWLMVFV